MTTNGTAPAVASTAIVTQISTFFTSTSIPPSTITVQPVTTSTSSTSSSVLTSSPPPPQSSTSVPTTIAAAVTPTTVSQPAAVTTSVITQQQSTSNGAVLPALTIFLTSTAPVIVPASTVTSSSRDTTTSTTSSAASATSTSAAKSAGGLSAGGKIAVAVVVPVAAVALIVLALLFFWRRRKQRKDAEELRRKEVEDYGFNPNNDPTLPPVGAAGSFGDEPSEMKENDGTGYRGWGATPAVAAATRKPSTTLSSGNGAIGMARSDSGSNPGGYSSGSPTNATAPNSDVQSGDPLVGSPNGRPNTAGSETLGALGAAPVAMSNSRDIHRGPSNASSAYSGANRSDASGELPLPGGGPGAQYYNDGMYYDEGIPQHGPYSDGTYGGGQPVIRDVQARRNTRIENPSVLPPQGNAGIAQNF